LRREEGEKNELEENPKKKKKMVQGSGERDDEHNPNADELLFCVLLALSLRSAECVGLSLFSFCFLVVVCVVVRN
jgi:hypothetical protein